MIREQVCLMKMAFRWFGAHDDSISLEQIGQIPGCTGIFGSLPQYAPGEVWPENDIRALVQTVHDAGLSIEVIESVNVHEDIKMGLPSRDRYIDAYIQTIRNLAQCGIKVIVYNFMPVFDWLRTDLARPLPDHSTVMYYDDAMLQNVSPEQIVEQTSSKSNGFSLPGWEPERLAELRQVLVRYESIDEDKLLENYRYFLNAVIPVCEQAGVRMAVHPDDPAWPVFGIPRIAHTQEQLERILQLYDSPANSLCFCTGSFGSSPQNDVPAALRHFGERQRIACVHVRNIKFLGHKKFQESAHLSACGSLDLYEIMQVLCDVGFDGWLRPDHGRMIWGERARPGYGLYDRALGLTYLNGLWEAICKSHHCFYLETSVN